MTVSFVPGEPNKEPQAVSQAQWRGQSIMAYCSGNNLIILADDMRHLQTVYLDADASSVAVNNYNGTIAVAVGSQVQIYEPMNEFMQVPRWQFSTRLVDSDNHSQINIVDWGVQEEIITGSDYLTLWQVKKEFGIVKPVILWSMKQAAPVFLAKISQDSNLIASCTKYDKLLKVWNRLSFGENSLFDLSYLLHPSSITSIRWKGNDPKKTPSDFTNTLYTLGRDSILRIWSSHEYESSHLIQHWGSLDLFEGSCQRNGKKFVNMIDDYLVTIALKSAISKLYKSKDVEIQKAQPDLAIVTDSDGKMDIYALENLSQNPPKMMSVTKLKSVKFKPQTFVRNPEFLNFAEPLNDSDGDISLVIHDLNGVIRNVIVDLSFLINDDGKGAIGSLSHKLTGHNKSIQRIFRTSDGEAMLTTSRFEENAVWIPQYLKDSLTLMKKSIVNTPSPISMAVIMEKGNQLLTICSKKLILWDTSQKVAQKKFCFDISETEEPILFAQVPLAKHDHSKHYVIAIYKHTTKAWLVTNSDIAEFKVNDLPLSQDKIHLISPIDPVGAASSNDRAVLSTVTKDGVIQCFSGVIENDIIRWIEKCHLESEITNASYIRGSSIEKFAIVDESKKKLTIWDLNRNVLEYEENFDDIIRDVDWTSTFNKQSILAVGFEDYSLLYTQVRYDYTNKTPPFLAIKKIDIKSYTSHRIGDSIWLKDGILVVGAGNQIFVSDKELDLVNDKFTKQSIGTRNIVSNDILNLCSVLNGTLPLYHPQFVIQLLFIGKFDLAKEILLRLFLKIREIELSGGSIEALGSHLGFDVTKFWQETYVKSCDFEEPYTSFNNSVADSLKEKLTTYSLPYLTRHQQITLLSTIEAIEDIDKNILSLDDHGIRFYLGVKLHQLHRTGSQGQLTMRDINWALHSENKELLLQNIQSSVKDRKLTWSVAVEYGLSHWIPYNELVSTFEAIARNEFISQEKKDPSVCSIYYLALKKKQILIGLWRTSVGNPDQQKMLTFLKNDFRQPRWKSAALKNAFVLLSKHRYLMAACFFLLADSLKDSANVLIKQVKDIDLAIGVCRVYEGDNGPVLKDILTKHLLSIAVSNGDRWTTSYIFWKLKDQSKAIQALVKAPIDVVSEDHKSAIVLTERAKSFLEDDPLLVVLYKSLKEKSLGYFHGSLEISTIAEFDFILRVANIYTRMGCDYLSVSLVKNWKFAKSQDVKKGSSYTNLNGQAQEPAGGSLLEKYGLSPSARARKSVLIDQTFKDNTTGPSSMTSELSILEKYGLASSAINREDSIKEEELKQKGHNNVTPPPPTAFVEPDMSSFNFGF